jgi:dihydrodipicolinate synthase/N-acetylneuraminate lyase
MHETIALSGVLPALVTPFSNDGTEVDVAGIDVLVENGLAAGVAGFVPVGSTGEFTTLSVAERQLVVERVIEATAGRVPVIPGTGALSTAETIALSIHAERSGAAAVMIVPPWYGTLTWRELTAHFATVADRVSIPIMYYHIPDVSGARLTIDQLRELRRVAGVTLFKDTSGDAVAMTELLQPGGDGPTLLNGWDTLTFAALAAGARAVVWGVGSFMPEQCVRLYRLLGEECDLVAARALWSALWPVCSFLESTSYAAAVKAACTLAGLPAGPVRAPLRDLADEDRATLARLLQAAGVRLRVPVEV